MQGSGGAPPERPTPGTIERRRGVLGLPRSEVFLQDADGRRRHLTVIHLDGGARYETALDGRRLRSPAIRSSLDFQEGPEETIPVVLLPDLGDDEDPNAVAVCAVGGATLGHLPRELSVSWQPALIRLFNSCDVHVSCLSRLRLGAFPEVRIDATLPQIHRLLDDLRQASDDQIALEGSRSGASWARAPR